MGSDKRSQKIIYSAVQVYDLTKIKTGVGEGGGVTVAMDPH